jgi:hypothetical protein
MYRSIWISHDAKTTMSSRLGEHMDLEIGGDSPLRQGKEINNCVKELMVVLHGGFLWMEEIVSIDMKSITFMTSLSSLGKSPMQYLDEKKKDKALS